MGRYQAITLKVAAATGLTVMGTTVDFHDDATFKAGEVSNEGADGNLTAKTMTRNLALA